MCFVHGLPQWFGMLHVARYANGSCYAGQVDELTAVVETLQEESAKLQADLGKLSAEHQAVCQRELCRGILHQHPTCMLIKSVALCCGVNGRSSVSLRLHACRHKQPFLPDSCPLCLVHVHR
jgi:hypothetical protein